MMKLSSIVAKAKQDPAFLQSLMTMVKVAKSDSEGQTSFNENVPAADEAGQGKADDSEQKAGRVPQMVDNTQVQGEQAIPIDQGQQGQAPEDVGAAAARAFIGPEVFQAAVAGDPGAINLVASVAAQIASQAQNPQPQVQGAPGMDQTMTDAGVTPEEYEAMMASGQMEPAQSPEEQVANLIVAPQQAAPAQPVQPPQQQKTVNVQGGAGPDKGSDDGQPEQQPQPGKSDQAPEKKNGNGDSVDDETIARIVKLVKNGKI